MNVPIHGCFDAGVPQKHLQNLGLHTTFYGTSCISVAQSMHTEMRNVCFFAQLIEMCVIGTVFGRLPGSIVDKNQIGHLHRNHCAGATIHVFQLLGQKLRLLAELSHGFFIPQ